MIPTATEIAAWANKRDAQALMPILLRRLIHGSLPRVVTIGFPGGDSVQLGGFDGTLQVDRGNAWIPDGGSVWESGCNKHVKDKADSDYANRTSKLRQKRTTKLRRKDRLETTFVFVTPRRWSKKGEWAARRRSERKWKDVRCLDADDLEQWLERNPSAATWLAERMGSPAVGFASGALRWDLWANACDPALPARLVLAGREEAAKTLRAAMNQPPGDPITISADSRDEVLSFVYAALAAEDDMSLSDRLLIATDSSPVERLYGMSDVILAIDSELLEARVGGLARQIHLIVPRARGEAGDDTRIALGSIRADLFDECLKGMGLSDERAMTAARESGRSLPVLRRRWAKLPGVKRPPWAGDKETARKLVPLALCGRWDMQRDGDLEVLAGIANLDREAIERDIANLLTLDDSPLEPIGTVNRVVSQIDALFAAGKRITKSDIERFFHVAEEAFGVRDPALDLPAEKRWMANVLGKEHPLSGSLLRGLGSALILLAIHGDVICGQRLGISVSGKTHVLVRTLLTDLTPEQWLSIQGSLRLLAEADPDAFLAAIERDLEKPDPPIMVLMQSAGDGITSWCLRTELLWALELVAWNPHNLMRVAEILAQLSRHPISDNWANKPSSSLHSLFRAWLPQTASQIEQRVDALQTIWRTFPDVAFRLCISLIDQRHAFAAPNVRPRWRGDAAGAGERSTTADELRMLRAAAGLLVSQAPSETRLLQDLIVHLTAFPLDCRPKIWDLVMSWGETGPPDDEKAKVRETIRRYALSRERDTESGNRARGQAAYERLEPGDMAARYRWLFESYWVEFPFGELEAKIDHSEREARIEQTRAEAISVVWEAGGLDGTLEFALRMTSPNLVGHVMVKRPPSGFAARAAIYRALALPATDAADLFVRGVLGTVGEPELVDELEHGVLVHQQGEIGDAELLRLLRAAPTAGPVWKAVATIQQDLAAEFWRTVRVSWGLWSSEETESLVRSLLVVNRPRTAFFAAQLNMKALSSDLVLMMLEAVATGAERDVTVPDDYHLEEAFERVDEDPALDRTRIARVEFAFVPALVRGRRGPAALYQQLANDPSVFVQLIGYLYRRADGGSDPEEWRIGDSDSSGQIARVCWEVLDHWQRLPGQASTGAVDAFRLKSWVAESRRLCQMYGRAESGDFWIGQILARAPGDEDDTWPCVPVREVLEEARSQTFERGFFTAVINKGGVTSRHPFAGGAQERGTAQQYEKLARAVEAKWHRTARVMREVAEYYGRSGESMDAHARLNQLHDL